MIDLVSEQCGVVALDQLAALGFGAHKVRRAVAEGWLERQGPRLVVDRNWSAGGDKVAEWRRQLFSALCNCPPRQRGTAVFFRRSAAGLWGLDGIDAVGSGAVELAVASGRPAAGTVFRVRDLAGADRSQRAGLPVTSVSRTLVDLGQVVGADIMERALESALRHNFVSVAGLASMLGAAPGLRGTRALRRLLAERPPGLPPTDSDAETLFLQLARRAGLPPPERQFSVWTRQGKVKVDFAWPLVRLAIEIDGAATHASGAALTRDLRRQNQIMLVLGAAGWVLLRFSWADIVGQEEASRTAAILRETWSLNRARAN